MRRFAKAGLASGIVAGLIVICRDLVMQAGWLLDEPLWYLGQASCLTIIAAVIGAVVGTIIGTSLFALMVLLNRRRQEFDASGLVLGGPLAVTAAAVFLLGTYYPQSIKGLPELIMLSLFLYS